MKNKINLKELIKDPMFRLLAAVLLFLTVGTAAGAFFGTQKKKVIVLDASFGGEYTGNSGIVNEADVSHELVGYIEKELKKTKKFDVVITDSGSVKDRAVLINELEPDLVISIHAAYSGNPEDGGMLIYPEPSGSSFEAAQAIQNAFAVDNEKPGIRYKYYEKLKGNRYAEIITENAADGNGRQTWLIMEEVNAPVVVVEQFHVSSRIDTDVWANENGYQKAAGLYAEALKALYEN